MVPREGNITLRQLLTLTAGLSYPIVDHMAAVIDTVPTGMGPFMPAHRVSGRTASISIIGNAHDGLSNRAFMMGLLTVNLGRDGHTA
jgi:CubicO group peptidase (beta-lactamase class C family)